MMVKCTGRVLFRNRVPAAGVQVRVFDRDDPGKFDDDLTVSPGTSNSGGDFKVSYDPQRYLDKTVISGVAGQPDQIINDYSDRYIPYLKFLYQVNEQERTYTAPILPNRREYILPETAPLRLKPSQNGFAFYNSFPGYPLPFSLSALPGIKEVGTIHGLCGGISAAIYDFYLCGRQAPDLSEVPPKGSALYKYLYKRQMQTFGTLGDTVRKFAEWMLLPDEGPNGTHHRSVKSLAEVMNEIDDGNAVILGLVYVDWRNGFPLWLNHQVLAYAYTQQAENLTSVSVCDPNYPRNDHVDIRLERYEIERAPGVAQRSIIYGLKCSQWVNGQFFKSIRGFFTIPYVPVNPPKKL